MSDTLKSLLLSSAQLEDQLIAMAGELTPELEESLLILELKIPQKITNYCRLLDRLELEGENLYNKSVRYKEAATALANLRDRLLANVKSNMIENELTEIKGIDEIFTITKGKPSVVITQLSELPREYIVQTVSERPDKDKIYQTLKSGEQVPGAGLQETNVLKRKINKGVK